MEHPFRVATTRIGTGLAAMATLAWFLWPASDWKLEPEPLAAFVVALGGWLAAEIIPVVTQVRAPHRHDVELLGRLQALITPDHLTLLRDQDFGGTIHPEPLQAFFRFRLADAWRGAAFEFEDKKVHPAFGKLLGTAREFAELVVTLTYDRGHHLSAKTDQNFQQGVSPVTRQRMRDMNAKATELLNQFEAFYRLTRTRLQS